MLAALTILPDDVFEELNIWLRLRFRLQIYQPLQYATYGFMDEFVGHFLRGCL